MKRSKIFNFFLFLALLLVVERFCYIQTKGFRLPKATTTHPYPFYAPFTPPPKSLHQTFTFLGSGVQFYVFMGEDQKTILKLFKHHHTGPSNALVATLFPENLKRKIFSKREERMYHLLKSVQIAADYLPNQTGLIYTHLQKGEHGLGSVTIYDKLRIPHKINLDQTEFFLQKRAIPVRDKLADLFREKKTENTISLMENLLSYVEKRHLSGIKNKDGKILDNYGFIEEEPVEIDLGSFVIQHSYKPGSDKKTRLKATLQLLSWIKQHYPSQFRQCKERLLEA